MFTFRALPLWQIHIGGRVLSFLGAVGCKVATLATTVAPVFQSGSKGMFCLQGMRGLAGFFIK